MNLFVMLGVIGILSVVMLGCTAQSTKQSETASLAQEAAAAESSAPVESNLISTPEPAGSMLSSAMEWYPTAEAEALKWRTDAKLIEVSGDNRDGNKYFEIDGKTNMWTYSFVSVTKLTKYRIIVEEGVITGTDVYDEPLAKMMYDSSLSGNSWVIDSTSAVNTVNLKAGGQSFIDSISKIRANYLLKFTGMGDTAISWTISYFPENYGQNFIATVDGETGNII